MPNPAFSADLALLTEAAEAAGKVAARHFGRSPHVWDKGGGQGPVTEADLEIEALLRARLGQARPDYGWLSEEGEPVGNAAARMAADLTFVIDPIDGTRAFIDGQKSFAHALAVVRHGQPVAAVVHLPLMGLTYSATLGAGAMLNGQPLRASQRSQLSGARILAARAALDPEHWPMGVPQVEREFRPSLAWRLALVGEGAFDAMLTLRDTWDWDIAAAALIATEAGATVSDRSGAALRFNGLEARSPGVVAASTSVHAALLSALSPPAQQRTLP